MGLIAHMRCSWKQLNTFAQRYDYTITFINRIQWSLFVKKMNSLHQKMLCAKFGWNWPSDSGEEDFQISSMYFCYFVIIPLGRGRGLPFEQTWIPFTNGYFVPGFIEIGSITLKKRILKFSQYIFAISLSSPLGKGHGQWIAFGANCDWNWPSGSGEVEMKIF